MVANLVIQYNYVGLPVINNNGILIGIITINDVLEILREKVPENMLISTVYFISTY